MTSTHLPRSIQLDVRSYGRANMTKIADPIASFKVIISIKLFRLLY